MSLFFLISKNNNNNIEEIVMPRFFLCGPRKQKLKDLRSRYEVASIVDKPEKLTPALLYAYATCLNKKSKLRENSQLFVEMVDKVKSDMPSEDCWVLLCNFVARCHSISGRDIDNILMMLNAAFKPCSLVEKYRPLSQDYIPGTEPLMSCPQLSRLMFFVVSLHYSEGEKYNCIDHDGFTELDNYGDCGSGASAFYI